MGDDSKMPQVGITSPPNPAPIGNGFLQSGDAVARRPRKRLTKRRTARRPTRRARRESPAIPAPPRRLHNLPTQLTTFIGREQEIAEVKRLLGTTRLLTLTGSGGCGKTRLALQVATGLLDQYPDGVWFVDLAPVADPAFVPNSVAVALDVPEQPTRPLADTVADYLRTKSLLLALDNCEHLRAACQSVANHLLRASSTVRILATSREALGVEGEAAYRVPPLRLPDAEQLSSVTHLWSEAKAGGPPYESLAMALRCAHLTKPDVSRKCRRASSLDNRQAGR